MPVTHVRRVNATFPAVHTSDEDWEQHVRGWLTQYGANEEQTEQTLTSIRTQVEQQVAKPWLIASSEGLGAVPPADFLTNFEEVGATSTLDEIFSERMRQISKGYDAAHDDAHGLDHLLEIAGSYQVKFGETPTDEFFSGSLVKAAATLVAAIEFLGRAQARRAALGEPTS